MVRHKLKRHVYFDCVPQVALKKLQDALAAVMVHELYVIYQPGSTN